MSSIWSSSSSSSSSSVYLTNRIMPCPSESSIHPRPLGREKDVRETPYSCAGCKEKGLGKVYECDHVGAAADDAHYYLHPKCYELSSLTSNSSIKFPFLKSRKCDFVFQKGGAGGGKGCDACGKEVKGWSYKCKMCKKAHYLHPCCAHLPIKLKGEVEKGVVVLLRLEAKTSSKCQACNSKDVAAAFGIRGWFYLSKDYCYHVGCVKHMALQNLPMNATPAAAAGDVDGDNQYGLVKETTATAASHDDHDHEKSSYPRTNQSSRAITKRRSPKARATMKVLKQATKIILNLIISAILGIPVTDVCVAVYHLF